MPRGSIGTKRREKTFYAKFPLAGCVRAPRPERFSERKFWIGQKKHVFWLSKRAKHDPDPLSLRSSLHSKRTAAGTRTPKEGGKTAAGYTKLLLLRYCSRTQRRDTRQGHRPEGTWWDQARERGPRGTGGHSGRGGGRSGSGTQGQRDPAFNRADTRAVC